MECVAVTSRNKKCQNLAKINIYCKVHIKTNHKYIMYKDIKIKRINLKKFYFLLNYEKYIQSKKELNGALIENQNDIDIILNELNELNGLDELFDNNNIFDNIDKDSICDMLSNLIKEEKKRLNLIEQERIERERLNLMKEEKITQERLNAFKEIKECKCCFDEYEHSNLIKCDKADVDNRHLICVDCIKRYINVSIEKSQINFKCVYDLGDKSNKSNKSNNCNGFYNNETFKSILDENEYSKFIDLYEISEVREISSIIPNYQICPKCRKFGIQIDSNKKLIIKCGKCLFKWCNICQKQSHLTDCDYIDISNIKQENLENHIDNILIEMKNKTIMHTCPHCNSVFIKEEGCNLIKCSTCNGYSCYVCGIKINSYRNTYYHHFKDHALNNIKSTCELWNGKDGSNETNKNANNIKLIQNYKHLMLVNSKSLRPIIYNKLLKIHNKDNLKNEIKKIGKELKLESECNIL